MMLYCKMPDNLKVRSTQHRPVVFYVPFLVAGMRFFLYIDIPPNTGITVAFSYSRVKSPTCHITGSFRDESFEAINVKE